MEVTALAGGTGGAKLLVGVQRLVPTATAIVNTGDDDRIYGVHVSPDVDMVTYWLAGMADLQRGWGLEGDTFHAMSQLRAIGADTWFNLGDRDLATCLFRSVKMDAGMTLSHATALVRTALGVSVTVLPMSDDPVRTKIVTDDGRTLSFQEYFVREQHRPHVAEVIFDGIEEAKPAPGVIDALQASDVVIVTPSNPVVSIGPIISLPDVRATLRSHPRVVAVSPIVEGRALKGPAEDLLRSAGAEVSASGVAALYSDFVDIFVVDERDEDEARRLNEQGIETIITDTVMTDHDAAERVARSIL